MTLITLLNGFDLGLATVLSVGLTAVFSPEHGWSVLPIWLTATWVAWFLTRESRQALALDPYARAITTPLLAALLAYAFAALTQLPLPLPSAAALTLLLGGGMGISRLVLRRRVPPVRIGVCAGNQSLLPADSRVVFVQFEHPDEVRLAEMDGLFLDSALPLGPEWIELVLHAQAAGTRIWTRAALAEELYGRVALEYLHTARLDASDFHDTYAVVKRVCDVLAVLLALPVLLPLMAVVAALVALDAGRPVLFWQWRVGQLGQPFRIAKFRTMKRDSEANGAAFASTGDLRVTRLGGVLRKFRLDELPQFWNVLRGDMSIIGPRPEQQVFVDRFEREIRLYPVRHWVKPGITGWAQVMHGYAAGADETREKLRYDIFYVKNFSFWLDARIVAKTIWTICTGFGAR